MGIQKVRSAVIGSFEALSTPLQALHCIQILILSHIHMKYNLYVKYELSWVVDMRLSLLILNSSFISILKFSFYILDRMGHSPFCSHICSSFLEKSQCLQRPVYEIAPNQAGLGRGSSQEGRKLKDRTGPQVGTLVGESLEQEGRTLPQSNSL